MKIDTLAIVGVGLMGASVGAAALAKGVARQVIGVDTSIKHLESAFRNRSITAVASHVDLAVRESDFVVVCTPVDSIANLVVEASRCAEPHAVITDVGSTKRRIVEAVEKLAPSARYVGSHPMAGSEKKGPDFARNDLFDNRPVILTCTNRTDPKITQLVTDFWNALGSRVVTMTPEEHDAAVAAVSHLPHAVSAALAGCTDLNLVPVSAGGWRDTTRVAGAGPGIWTPIFRENREAVIAALDHFSDHLAGFRRLLEADDGPGITAWLVDAKRVRDALGS